MIGSIIEGSSGVLYKIIDKINCLDQNVVRTAYLCIAVKKNKNIDTDMLEDRFSYINNAETFLVFPEAIKTVVQIKI